MAEPANFIMEESWSIKLIETFLNELFKTSGINVPPFLPPNLVPVEARWLRDWEGNKTILMIQKLGWVTAKEIYVAFQAFSKDPKGKREKVDEKRVGHLRDHLNAISNAGILSSKWVDGRTKKFRTRPQLETLVILCKENLTLELNVLEWKLDEIGTWCL